MPTRDPSNYINPSLAEALRVVERSIGARLRVALPGKVTKYDQEKGFADVQPLLLRKLEDEQSGKKLPVIPKVSVIHPRSSAGAVFLPLDVGDLVTLIFSDRALDRWKSGNGQFVEPSVSRQHDLTDCWAIPGGYPEGLPPSQRFPGALEIWLKSGTKFAVSNGTDELVDLMVQFLDLFINGQLLGNLGYPTSVSAQFALLRIKLMQFKAEEQ